MYTFLINFEEKRGAFRVTMHFSDFSHLGEYLMVHKPDERQFNVITISDLKADQLFRGTLNYIDRDKIIWTGWRSKYLKDKEWELVFQETSTPKK